MKTKYDLIVVGGGFAGAAAAIAAAKEGIDVLLVERYNCLGGAASSALVSPFMSFDTRMPETKEKKYLCGSLLLEMIREMNPIAGFAPDSCSCEFDEEILKLVLNRMCQKYGVQLLYNTTVTAAEAIDGRVRALTAFCKGVSFTLEADSYIDATGDAELSVLAGCSYRLGRPADNLCQPMTLSFRLSGVDRPTFMANRHKINPLYKEFKDKGLIKNPRENLLIFGNFNQGVLHFNCTRVVKRNPTDPFDLTAAELEAREQVFETLYFLKNNIEGFEKARVLSTALHIGIRESRMVEGEYVLTQEDLKSLARFDDAIAVANYDIDIHNPEGEGTSHYYFKDGEWYEIPYRCLIPKGMKNLLVTGRCISSTHEAQASYRIMPFCSELGQAAGIAVAIAKKSGTDTASVDIPALQTRLREEGFLI